MRPFVLSLCLWLFVFVQAISAQDDVPREGLFVYSTYNVTIRCRPVDELVEAAGLTLANKDVSAEHFTLSCRRDYKTQLLLLTAEKHITAQEVRQNLARFGLRPARLEELLAFAALKPPIEPKAFVLALGTVWRQKNGLTSFPALTVEPWIGEQVYSPIGAWTLDLYWLTPTTGFPYQYFHLAVPLNP